MVKTTNQISDNHDISMKSPEDRILVPDSSISCGDVATAHALAFRSHLCGRGDSACIATPGNGPPTGLQNMGELVGDLAKSEVGKHGKIQRFLGRSCWLGWKNNGF